MSEPDAVLKAREMSDPNEATDVIPVEVLERIQGVLNESAVCQAVNDGRFDVQPIVTIRRKKGDAGSWICTVVVPFVSDLHIIQWDGDQLTHALIETDEIDVVRRAIACLDESEPDEGE